MVFVAITLVVSLVCLALSWAQIRRISECTAPNLKELTRLLKKTDQSHRIDELFRLSAPDTWEHKLGAELLETSDQSHKIFIINDTLADVDHRLGERSGWPRASVRLCGFGTMLCAVSALLMKPDMTVLLMVLGTGGAGALMCALASRKAAQEIASARENIDAFVSALLGARAFDHRAVQGSIPRRRSPR